MPIIKSIRRWKKNKYIDAHKKVWNLIIEMIKKLPSNKPCNYVHLKEISVDRLFPGLSIISDCFACEWFKYHSKCLFPHSGACGNYYCLNGTYREFIQSCLLENDEDAKIDRIKAAEKIRDFPTK